MVTREGRVASRKQDKTARLRGAAGWERPREAGRAMPAPLPYVVRFAVLAALLILAVYALLVVLRVHEPRVSADPAARAGMAAVIRTPIAKEPRN